MIKKRLKEIDIASGLAIMLVVFGHLSDYDPSWYGDFKNTLYKFHMPFFMFISGFLLSYTSENHKDLQSIKSFVIKKLIRFGIPYLFMSFLFFGVRILLNDYDSISSTLDGLKHIFIEPTSGPAIFLWYIYVLFQFYVVFTLLNQLRFMKDNRWVLIGIGVLLFLLKSISGVFELNLFCKYFLFFAIGYVLANYYLNFKIIVNKIGLLSLLVFLGLIISDMLAMFYVPVLILGLLAIPVFMYVSIQIRHNKLLEFIGKKTFTIYLWNSVFIFTLSFLFKTLDTDFLTNFGFYVPIFIISGIYGPLTLRNILRKFNIQILNKIMP